MTDTAAAEISKPDVSPGIRLDSKHPLAIRWMHWINFPVLFTMIWSGMIAYTNEKPDDYWTKLGYDWYAGL